MATNVDELTLKITAVTSEASAKINQLKDNLKNLKSELSNVDTSSLKSVSAETRQMASEVKSSAQSVKTSFSDMAQSMKNVGEGATQTAKGLSELKEVPTIAQTSSEEVKNLSNNVKNLKKVSSKSLGLDFKGMIKNLKLVNKATKSFKSANNALAKSLLRVGKMLRLMVVRMALRALISEVTDGFKNLAQASTSFNADISLLWNSLRQLGNAFASAVAPMLAIFKTSLNDIIQYIIKAVNAINQLMSALSGASTWKRAKVLTDSYADSLNTSSKKAKELKKTVLGFDELNQLQDNSDSGSGMTKPQDMFEDAKVSQKIADLAKKIRDFFKEFLGLLKSGEFEKAGRMLSKAITDALNSIPWDTIKEKAREAGTAIAEFLNGFINPELFGAIGRTLAEILNTLLEFANAFGGTFNWKNLGESLAEGIDEFFKAWDAKLTGETLSNFATGILDALTSALNGLVDKEFGKTLGEKIADFIMGIKWKEVGISLFEFEKALTDFLVEIPAQIGEGFALELVSELFNIDKSEIENSKAFKNFSDALKYVTAIAITPIAPFAGIKTAFDLLKKSAEDTTSPINKLAKSFEDFKEKASTAIKGTVDSIKEKFGNIADWFKSNVTDPIQQKFDTVSSYIKSIFENAVNVVEAIWILVADWFETNVIQPIEDFFAKLKANIYFAFNTLYNNVVIIWSKASGWFFSTVIEPIKSAFETACNSVKGFFEHMWEDIKLGAKSALNFLISKVEGFINSVIDGINGFTSKLSSASRMASKITGKSYDSIATIPHVSLPRYREGGFPEDGLFMANHNEMVGRFSNGKTAVANNEQITQGIENAVYRALMNAGINNGGDVYVNAVLKTENDEVLARAVERGQRRRERRFSPTMA